MTCENASLMRLRRTISVSGRTYDKLQLYALRRSRSVSGLVEEWLDDEFEGARWLCRSGYPRQRSAGVGEDVIA